MAESALQIAAVTLFEDDLAAAKAFYQKVFGVVPVFEDADSVCFRFGKMLINLLKAGAAEALVAPAPVGSRDEGVRGAFTTFVDDVDAVCRYLEEEVGVTLLSGPVNRPVGVRTAAFEDPSGHVWEVSQDMPSRFMLLIRVGEGVRLSPAERATMHGKLDAWLADLDARGARLLGSELLGGATTRLVCVRDGQPEVREGDAAGDEERVTGFDIIECANLDEAVDIALRHPVAAFGTIEVRPFGF